jgi:predicted nucleic acid-binding protein
MNGEVFFDTNILLYSVNSEDPRGATARRLVHGGGVVSVQNFNEFASVLRRTLRWEWPIIAEALASLRRLCAPARALSLATHEGALRIAARDGLSFYDSLVVASALEARCTTLLSEDMQHGRVIDGRLTIRNPFV